MGAGNGTENGASGAVEKACVREAVIPNEVRNLSVYAEERCIAIAQHDSLVGFSTPPPVPIFHAK